MKILVLIDCQNDFIWSDLGSKEAQNAVPKICDRILNGGADLILLTQDTHKDYFNTRESEHFLQHCIKNTEGWEIEPSIMQAVKDSGIEYQIIEKSSIGSYDLAGITHDACSGTRNEVEICGFCTDICVTANALMIESAVNDCAYVRCVSECCAGSTKKLHKKALDVMRSSMIDII